MKKLLILSLMFSVALTSNSDLQANILFPDTAPTTKVETRYSKQMVKGKDTLTINAFDKQTYYIYVASNSGNEGVIINFDSPLKDYIPLSESLFYLKPSKEEGGVSGKQTVIIKPKKPVQSNESIAVQFKTQAYSLNIELIFTPYNSWGNKYVYFQDGSKNTNQKVFSQARFMDMEAKFQEKLSKRESLMSYLLLNDATFFSINESIKYKDTSIKLNNMAVVEDLYLFNLTFDGEDQLELTRDMVRLNLRPFNYSLATELSKHTDSEPLIEFVEFRDYNGRPSATLMFKIPKNRQVKRFFVELYLTPYIVFRKKVNMDYSKESSNARLFDVDVR